MFCGCELDGNGLWIGSSEDAFLGFFNNKFGEGESNALYFRDDLVQGNNVWSEITAYPDYEPDAEDFRYNMTIQTLDPEAVSRAWYSVWYTDYTQDIDNPMPLLLYDSNELFQLTLLLYKNGTGQIIGFEGNSEPLDFSWEMTDDQNMILSAQDAPGFAVINAYADEAASDPETYLLLYLDGEQFWFQYLDMEINP